ncbi:hypothetical protein [Crenalkalicoccus roseus]|uniref:hypothetical protein n=1 Tax=Crenalkalicoccus roseus TaxID=1485588 RepID=UPI00108158D1|nr:hypothetical protein [Crenalkalicoccus roseus]
MLRRAFAAALLGLLAVPAEAQTGDPSFRIVNNTPRTVFEVYASPSTDRSWGHDRLGSEVIPPGGRHIIRLPADGNCIYDVRIVYQGGAAEERRNVNLCAVVDYVLGGGAPPTQAANPSFNLVNQGRRTIREFYASPSSQQGWGPDRLGTEVVGPGQRFPVRLPVGECTYDIRIVFQDGEAREQRRINACSIVDYVVR